MIYALTIVLLVACSILLAIFSYVYTYTYLIKMLECIRQICIFPNPSLDVKRISFLHFRKFQKMLR